MRLYPPFLFNEYVKDLLELLSKIFFLSKVVESPCQHYIYVGQINLSEDKLPVMLFR